MLRKGELYLNVPVRGRRAPTYVPWLFIYLRPLQPVFGNLREPFSFIDAQQTRGTLACYFGRPHR